MNNERFELFTDKRLGESYYRIRHACGLDAYVIPKKMTTKTALLGVRLGSLYEKGAVSDGRVLSFPSGSAHYLEHKLFTNEGDTDAAQELAALGADANAYTSNNKTVYMFSCTENFNASLEALVNFVYHPYFTDENVESERGIISQEIRMCLDSPYDAVAQGLLEALYGEGVISTDVLGTEKTIAQISAGSLYECYGAFYRYSNMALVVCGDVDPNDVVDVLDRTLPRDRSAAAPELPSLEYCREAVTPHIEKYMPVSAPVFEIGIKDDHPSENVFERMRRDAVMTVLDEIIFSQTGELYNELFEGGHINESYSYGYSSTRDVAFHSIYAEGEDPAAVLEAIKSCIARMQRSGVRESDFIRCKRVVMAEYIRDLDSVDEAANTLLNMVLDGTDPFEYGRIIESVTLSDVEERLKDAFDDWRFALSVVRRADDTVI